jgi:hypothetical protein
MDAPQERTATPRIAYNGGPMDTIGGLSSEIASTKRALRLALVQLEMVAWGLALIIGVGIAETLGVLVAALYLVPTLALAAVAPLLLRGDPDER